MHQASFPEPGPEDQLYFWLDRGRYDRAVEVARQLLARDPENPDLHRIAAVCHWALADKTEARHHFSECLRLKPDCDETQALYAAFASSPWVSRSADSHAMAALAINPESTQAWMALAQSSLADDPEFSIRCTRRALAIDPGNIQARLILAGLLQIGDDASQRHDEILAIYHEGLMLDPESAETHACLGQFLMERRRTRAAGRQHMIQALAIDPSHPSADDWREVLSVRRDWLLKLMTLPRTTLLAIISGFNALISKHFILLLLLFKIYLPVVILCLVGLVAWGIFLGPPTLFHRFYVNRGESLRSRLALMAPAWLVHLAPRNHLVRNLASVAVTIGWCSLVPLGFRGIAAIHPTLHGGNVIAFITATMICASAAFLGWLYWRKQRRKRQLQGVEV